MKDEEPKLYTAQVLEGEEIPMGANFSLRDLWGAFTDIFKDMKEGIGL
jgi:hypothetical protein